MSPEEQRIAIAESVGWKLSMGTWYRPNFTCLHIKRPCSDGDVNIYPPDYLNDLNAMHEVTSRMTVKQKCQFADYLYNNSGKDILDYSGVYYPGEYPTIDLECVFCVANATAAQRAEAYLKTIGKWTDK